MANEGASWTRTVVGTVVSKRTKKGRVFFLTLAVTDPEVTATDDPWSGSSTVEVIISRQPLAVRTNAVRVSASDVGNPTDPKKEVQEQVFSDQDMLDFRRRIKPGDKLSMQISMVEEQKVQFRFSLSLYALLARETEPALLFLLRL